MAIVARRQASTAAGLTITPHRLNTFGMLIEANDTILFTGDSITDCGRARDNAESLGTGYAALTAAHLQARLASPELKIYNRGISGNRVCDLLQRVEADLIALRPT